MRTRHTRALPPESSLFPSIALLTSLRHLGRKAHTVAAKRLRIPFRRCSWLLVRHTREMTSQEDLQLRAVEFAKAGEFSARALEVNLELTQLTPANEGAWTRLARCYMELGQLDEATAALEAALQVNPQNTIARNLQNDVTKRRVGVTAPVAAA